MDAPENLADLFSDPERIKRAFQLLKALENLAIVDAGGVRRPIRISAENSVIDQGRVQSGVVTPTPPDRHWETQKWISRVLALNGTFTDRSIEIADNLIRAINNSSYNSKIKYLLPLLGGDLAAARVPLRIPVAATSTVNSTSFVEADFSEASGLTGDGIGKWFEIPNTLPVFGTGDNGGIGYLARSLPVGSWHIGLYTGSQIYGLNLGPTTEMFHWGDGNSPAATSAAAGPYHYYGQRATATDRRLYRNGVEIALSELTSSVTQINSQYPTLLRLSNDSTYSNNRCGGCYFTDGTMTPTEIVEFYALLQTYLIDATGR